MLLLQMIIGPLQSVQPRVDVVQLGRGGGLRSDQEGAIVMQLLGMLDSAVLYAYVSSQVEEVKAKHTSSP